MSERSRAICYPLKAGGTIWKNLELLHSLRSLDMHWKGGGDVFLLSSIRPPWLSDEIQFVRAEGYMEAMKAACDLGDDILWMNDDIYFLKDTDWEYVRLWKRGKQISVSTQEQMLVSKNGWRRRLGEVAKKLREMGLTTWKYSTHTPYFYEAEKLRECIEIFECGYKTPIETAYGNYFDVPVNPHRDKLRRYAPSPMPLDLRRFRYFNHNNAGLGPHAKGFLRGRFPNPCRFELAYRESVADVGV